MDHSTQTNSVLKALEDVLLHGDLPDRAARSLEDLAEKLRRPVRATLLGIEAKSRRMLMSALLGVDMLPVDGDWPTVEIAYASRPVTHATLSDGSTLTIDGLPGSEISTVSPAYLRIEAPIEVLRRITLLYLAAGSDPAEQAAALRWAERRTDLSIWCTRRYLPREARIWRDAPDMLKNHSFLVVLGDHDRGKEIKARVSEDFDAVVTLPRRDARALLRQIEGDIDAALREDVDVARALMQRFAPGHQIRADGSRPAKPVAPVETRQASNDRAGLLSEPLLYLRRRARAAFQMLDWQDSDGGDSHSAVLDHCCETASGLRERAAGWPEFEDDIDALKQFVDGASDMAVLLQIEGGEEQAADAARLIYQLRTALEQAIAGPASPTTKGMSS